MYDPDAEWFTREQTCDIFRISDPKLKKWESGWLPLLTSVDGLFSAVAVRKYLPERLHPVSFDTLMPGEARAVLGIAVVTLRIWEDILFTPFTLPKREEWGQRPEIRYVKSEVEAARNIPLGTYSLEEAAKTLGLTIETLHAYLKDGTIQPGRKGQYISWLSANALRKFAIDRLYWPR